MTQLIVDPAPEAVTSPLAIEVRDLTMSYGARRVLAGVDFEVRRGEVFCLLGPNGAGKTTTVEILEGFRSRTGGTVHVLGLDPADQPARLRERIGIVLQECGFPRQARVAELIDIWRAYYPAPRPLEELLALVELTADRHCQVRRLSGGQRRRLDFALALAGDPDLVFLDEPTTGFDPESRRRCWAAIENLRALGKTIVLTTHYLDGRKGSPTGWRSCKTGASRPRARCARSPGRRACPRRSRSPRRRRCAAATSSCPAPSPWNCAARWPAAGWPTRPSRCASFSRGPPSTASATSTTSP